MAFVHLLLCLYLMTGVILVSCVECCPHTIIALFVIEISGHVWSYFLCKGGGLLFLVLIFIFSQIPLRFCCFVIYSSLDVSNDWWIHLNSWCSCVFLLSISPRVDDELSMYAIFSREFKNVNVKITDKRNYKKH